MARTSSLELNLNFLERFFGRHCNMPHTQNELCLCYFHEKREIQRLMARDVGLQISRYLQTACDLNGSFAMLYRAGAQGLIDSKMINSLTRLGHLLVKTHLLAKEEYLTASQTDWSDIVQQSVTLRPAPDPHPRHNSNPAPPEPPKEESTEQEARAAKPSREQIVEDDPAQDQPKNRQTEKGQRKKQKKQKKQRKTTPRTKKKIKARNYWKKHLLPPTPTLSPTMSPHHRVESPSTDDATSKTASSTAITPFAPITPNPA